MIGVVTVERPHSRLNMVSGMQSGRYGHRERPFSGAVSPSGGCDCSMLLLASALLFSRVAFAATVFSSSSLPYLVVQPRQLPRYLSKAAVTRLS